jgi:hypothetical protein
MRVGSELGCADHGDEEWPEATDGIRI